MSAIEVRIHCPDLHFPGLFLSLGRFHGTLLFLGCRLIKPTNCKLSASQEREITANFLGQLTGGKAATITGAGPGEEFTAIEIVEKSGCFITNKYPVKGSQLFEIPKGEEPLAEQEGVAKKSGSHLFLGAKPASVSGNR